MMDVRRPKGIAVIAWFGIISSVWAIVGLFRHNVHAIVLGYILAGNLFRLYYVIISICILITSIGLLKMRRWGYIGTIIINTIMMIILLTNIYLISDIALIESGWKAGAGSISNYKYLMALGAMLAAGLNVFLFKYRHIFNLSNYSAG